MHWRRPSTTTKRSVERYSGECQVYLRTAKRLPEKQGHLIILREVVMAKKVLKFPEVNIARLRLMAHFAEDRNECLSDDAIRRIAEQTKIRPRKKGNQRSG